MSHGRDIGARDVELFDTKELFLLSRHAPAAVALHVGDLQHVRAIGIELEIVGNILTQNGGCKRAEAFAIFDLEIKVLLHLRIARIAQD